MLSSEFGRMIFRVNSVGVLCLDKSNSNKPIQSEPRASVNQSDRLTKLQTDKTINRQPIHEGRCFFSTTCHRMPFQVCDYFRDMLIFRFVLVLVCGRWKGKTRCNLIRLSMKSLIQITTCDNHSKILLTQYPRPHFPITHTANSFVHIPRTSPYSKKSRVLCLQIRKRQPILRLGHRRRSLPLSEGARI